MGSIGKTYEIGQNAVKFSEEKNVTLSSTDAGVQTEPLPQKTATDINVISVTESFGLVQDGGTSKRWNPHHGYKVQGDPADTDQASYWNKVTIGLGGSSPVNDSVHLEGVQFGAAWGTVEPTLGQRNWVELDAAFDLAAAQGLYVNLQLTYKNFREDAGLIGPTDLAADLLANTNSSGQPINVMAMHREHVMDRFVIILTDILARYGSRPEFEILSTAELLLSFGTGTPPGDYSSAALATQHKRMHQAIGIITTPVNFAANQNQLSGQMGGQTGVMESLWINRIMHGSPDLRETPGHTIFKGNDTTESPPQTAFRDYRLELGKVCTVSVQDWSFGAFTSVADILSTTIADYGLTHMYWANQEAGTFTWAELIAQLAINPDTLITSCPVRWPGCNVPIPPATNITGINFSLGTLINTAPGNSEIAEESDNWPITWAWDGNQYTSFGDGKGFHNLAGEAETRASFGFSRIDGTNTNYSAFDVFKSGKNMPDSETGKCYGMLGANAKLYAAVDHYVLESVKPNGGSQNDRYHGLSLISSADSGATWGEEIRWDAGDWGGNQLDGFYSMSFVQYGQDHGGTRSPKTSATYVYAILMEHDDDVYEVQIPGGISMIRCLESNLESGNKAHWEYISGIDGNNDPVWSTTITDRVMIFQDATGGNDSSSISYNEPLGRYLLTMFHNTRDTGAQASDCYIGIYEAPEPWGPWTTVLKDNVQTIGLADGGAVIYWNFSNKWLSGDGLTFTMVGTLLGQDEWGTVEGTFVVG